MAILCIAISAYLVVLFLRFILSWVTMFWSPPPSFDPVVRVAYDLTEPVLQPLRRYIPPVGGLDLSFLVLILILDIARRSLC